MAATKRDIALAMGEADPGAEAEAEEVATEDSDAAENDAIDTFLDTTQDLDTRREAFRRAVQLCNKSY